VAESSPRLSKAATGIAGLDEITGGGLPRGRATLVVGGPGCGKTLLAMEFLVCGALRYDEPGVFVAFEETVTELTENVRSLGYELDELTADKRLIVDHVRVERAEIEETGEYDLEGLFVRLGYAIDAVGAKRLALDTLEVLFAGLDDHTLIRAELRRLFRWLKERSITAVVTAERGPGDGMTRHGIEEYVADCVITLDHRVDQQVSTRRLRVVKYRGSAHGENEYPFLIDVGGFAVFPITSASLDYPAPAEHVSAGFADLDAALDGRGFYRGSSTLVSGTAGTGKTSIAAAFASAACARGERCLYYSMEESADQIARDMATVGIEIQRWRERGLLQLHCSRPTLHGLEQHLARFLAKVLEFEPAVVVIDPITNLGAVGSTHEVMAALTRILDALKSRGITGLFTSLGDDPGHSGISSWMDVWIALRMVEGGGLRRRQLSVIKARGMAHSEATHRLRFSSSGLQLTDWVNPDD
jgi:circadian clock protein KaiC